MKAVSLANNRVPNRSTRLRRRALLAVSLLLTALRPGRADIPRVQPGSLARGLNLAHWFRFPPRLNAADMASYMDTAAVEAIRRTGFTFVRLCVGTDTVMRGEGIEPAILQAVRDAVARLQGAGLAVIVEPHPEQLPNWNVERSEAAQRRVHGFWRDMGPALARFPVELTIAEVLNEPVYDDAAAWEPLQESLLRTIRSALSHNLVVVTGTDWGSIGGLLTLRTLADPNVLYSCHSYEPQLLTTLAEWEQGVDRAALARLPFPASNRAACSAAIAGIGRGRARDIANWWCDQRADDETLARNISRAAAWAREHGVHVALLEFGATVNLNRNARQAYLAAMRRAAEQHGMPWALWALDDSMGFALPAARLRGPPSLDPGVLAALGLGSSVHGDRR